MINKKIFKKITKHIFLSNKGIKIPKVLYPEREWATGLMVSVTLFIAICAYSIHTYREYECPFVEENNVEEVHPSVYREMQVNEALLKFSNQKEKHKQLIENLSQETLQVQVIVDESINIATSSLSGTSSAEILEDVEETNIEEEEAGITPEPFLE